MDDTRRLRISITRICSHFVDPAGMTQNLGRRWKPELSRAPDEDGGSSQLGGPRATIAASGVGGRSSPLRHRRGWFCSDVVLMKISKLGALILLLDRVISSERECYS